METTSNRPPRLRSRVSGRDLLRNTVTLAWWARIGAYRVQAWRSYQTDVPGPMYPPRLSERLWSVVPAKAPFDGSVRAVEGPMTFADAVEAASRAA